MSDERPAPPEAEPAAPAERGWLRSETLAQGMLLMILLAGGQRIIGFVRGVLFCRWLPPEELGTWDLAFGFLLLAAPLAVLGVPGAFGRYVEHYRQKGQLQAFLRNTAAVSILLALSGVALVALARGWFGWFIFDDPTQGNLVLLTAVCLLGVIANNFLLELFTALRQMRFVALMNLSNSALFALLGIALLFGVGQDAAMVVIAYGAGCLTTAVVASYALWRTWNELPIDGEALPRKSLWAKVAPFAAWVWMTNLLTNLFAVADRYMIVHFSGLEPSASAAVVGNYHSSRVVPLLIVSVAGMIAGMLLPHLTHDWEAGNRGEVSRRLNLLLKSFGLAYLLGAIAILALAGPLFSIVLAGKYAGGLEVLPWTLTYCVWFSLALMVEVYLWTAERPGMACLVFFIGLTVNIVLNYLLVPVWGLYGAVVATAAGNAAALLLAIVFSWRAGLKFDGAVALIAVLPATLLLGVVPAACVWIVAAAIAWKTNWFFDGQQKHIIYETVGGYVNRIKTTLARSCANA